MARLFSLISPPAIVVFASLVLGVSAFSGRVLTRVHAVPSAYSVTFGLGIWLLLLPSRFCLLSVPLAAATLYGLTLVNEMKVAAVGLPITFFDLKMFATEPTVVLNAVGFGSMIPAAIIVLVVLALGAIALTLLYGRSWRFWKTIAVRASALALMLGVEVFCLGRYGTFVAQRLAAWHPQLSVDLWTAESQVTLSRRLGVAEYIGFTHAAGDGGASFDLADTDHFPASDEHAAVSAYVNVTHNRTALLPNIVFFHAESTFDPNYSFRLEKRIDLPLWSSGDTTKAIGPLHVNVIGGGSWVTEFEILTGVDSRIFGYQGFYTHYYLSPMVRRSFPGYLASKGYTTAVFYPVDRFFRAEEAFRSYGFETFVGGGALGLSNDWSAHVDRDIAAAIVKYGAFSPRADPFFYFISTNENHGPHYCKEGRKASELDLVFAGAATEKQRCAFNEYLRRARSTSAAFEMVLERLQALERTTGRPYLLLAYGDHQPWSFTDGQYAVAGGIMVDTSTENFSALRTAVDAQTTFFHLHATTPTVMTQPRFNQPPPVTLLPTLVSAFIALDENDLYMPVNFLAFSRCGSDFRRPGCAIASELSETFRSALFSEPAQRSVR